jgi:hypothetical protein
VQQYQAELQRNRLQQSFERRIRRAEGPEGLTPVERAYYQAVQLGSHDPQAALARFEAILAVYGGSVSSQSDSADARNIERCLELAQQQVERLSNSTKKMNAEEQAEVRRQLARAEQLAASDPAAANRIWQGIITLYADKSWARELVAEAQAALTSH